MSESISIGHCCTYTQHEAIGAKGFGIDKLNICADVFSVDEWKPWNDRPNPTRKAGEETPPAPLYVMNVKGKDIYNGLYFNGTDFSADIGISKGTGAPALFISVNPSKLHGNLTAEPNAVYDLLKSVQAQMKDALRVDFPLMDCNISRLDFAADALMRYPVHTYAEHVRGNKRKPNAGNEYPNGFLFGKADAWQTCIYDRGLRIEQLHNKANGIKAAPNNSHLMRNEARYMSSKYLKRNATFSTFGGLLETPTNELHTLYTKNTLHFLNWNQIRTVFPSVEFTQLQTVLHDCIEQSPRNAIRDFVSALTLENPDLHTIDFKTLIYEAYHTRARVKGITPPARETIWRAQKRFQELRESAAARRAIMQHDAQELHISKLQELHAAFIEPYKTA
jgi:hypothetical protein